MSSCERRTDHDVAVHHPCTWGQPADRSQEHPSVRWHGDPRPDDRHCPGRVADRGAARTRRSRAGRPPIPDVGCHPAMSVVESPEPVERSWRRSGTGRGRMVSPSTSRHEHGTSNPPVRRWTVLRRRRRCLGSTTQPSGCVVVEAGESTSNPCRCRFRRNARSTSAPSTTGDSPGPCRPAEWRTDNVPG